MTPPFIFLTSSIGIIASGFLSVLTTSLVTTGLSEALKSKAWIYYKPKTKKAKPKFDIIRPIRARSFPTPIKKGRDSDRIVGIMVRARSLMVKHISDKDESDSSILSAPTELSSVIGQLS